MWLVCERTWQNLLYYSHVQFHSSIDHKHPLNTYKQDRVVIHWPKTKTKVNSAFIDQMTTCFYRSIHVMGYILKWSNHYRYIQVFLNPFISHRAPVTPCKLTPAPVYTPWLASLVPVHCLGLWKAPWQVGRPDVWPPPGPVILLFAWCEHEKGRLEEPKVIERIRATTCHVAHSYTLQSPDSYFRFWHRSLQSLTILCSMPAAHCTVLFKSAGK